MVKRSNPAFDLRLRSAVEQLGWMCAVIEVSVIRAERTAHTSGAAVARAAAHDHHRVEIMRSRVKRDAMRLAWRASRTGDLRVVLTLVRQADSLSRLSSWVPELVAVARDAATVDDRDLGQQTSEMNRAAARLVAALHHLILRGDRVAADRFAGAADRYRRTLDPITAHSGGGTDLLDRAQRVYAEILLAAVVIALAARTGVPSSPVRNHDADRDRDSLSGSFRSVGASCAYAGRLNHRLYAHPVHEAIITSSP